MDPQESYLQIKVFNRTATVRKEILQGDLLLSEIAFTANINGGQGELVMSLNKSINDTSFALGDVIVVNKY